MQQSDRPPPLVTAIGKQYVSDQGRYLYMVTGGKGARPNYLFYDQAGQLAFRVVSSGIFFEKKVLQDGQGRVICSAKKLFLSLAKWSITNEDGKLLAKTRCVAGLAKYGIDVDVPSASRKQPVFRATPDTSLRQIVMWQLNGKGEPDTPFVDAAYGSNVVLGFISAFAQDWTYNIVLQPGADAPLACLMLAIYTELVEWNAANFVL